VTDCPHGARSRFGREESGRCTLLTKRHAAELARRARLNDFAVSLSHEGNLAAGCRRPLSGGANRDHRLPIGAASPAACSSTPASTACTARSGTFEKVVRGVDDLRHLGPEQDQRASFSTSQLSSRDMSSSAALPALVSDLFGLGQRLEGRRRPACRAPERARTRRPIGSGCSTPSDVGLCSAACPPPLSPLLLRDAFRRWSAASRVFGHCFRHEPSLDPARMQGVSACTNRLYLGDPDGAVAHRDLWLERFPLICCRGWVSPSTRSSRTTPSSGELDRCSLRANAPTTSSTRSSAQLTLDSQPRRQSPRPTINLDHFGIGFKIESANGDVAHTACVGFGCRADHPRVAGKHTGLTPVRGRRECGPASGRETPVQPGGHKCSCCHTRVIMSHLRALVISVGMMPKALRRTLRG